MTTTQQQAAIERAKRMSELVLEIEEIDKARREVAKDFRERIDGRMKELKDLAREERDGQLRLPESPSTEAGDAIGRRSAAIAIFKKAVANIVVALETEDAELLAKASDDDLMALLNLCPLLEDAKIEFSTDTAGGSVTLDKFVRDRVRAELDRRVKAEKPAKKGGKR